MLVFISTGCTYLQDMIGDGIQKPQVSLKSIKIKNITNQSRLDLWVELQVFNPNNFSVDFSQLDYKVMVDDQLIADGQYHESISLASGDQILLKLPLKIKLSESFGALSKLIFVRNKVVAYWSAQAYFLSPIGKFKVSSSDQKIFE